MTPDNLPLQMDRKPAPGQIIPSGSPVPQRTLLWSAGIILIAVVIGGTVWLKAAPGAQPKVTWSAPGFDLTLSPGDTTTRTVTLTSDTTIKNAQLEAVPAIASFLTIRPRSITELFPSQPQKIELSITIPQGGVFGTYTGTVLVRTSGQAIPQTFKVLLNVWPTVTDLPTGISLKYPPTWTVNADDGVLVLSSRPQSTSDEFPGDILVFKDANPLGLSLHDFYSTFRGGYLYHDSTAPTPIVIGPIQGIRFNNAVGLLSADVVVIPTRTTDFLRIEHRGTSLNFGTVLQTLSLN